MKAKGIVIFLVLMILLSFISANLINAEEQDQKEVLSFTKGNEYLEFDRQQKLFYVRGLMDAIWAILDSREPEMYEKYEEVTEGMTLLQLTKILDKYLEENPEKLHYIVVDSFLWALNEIVYKVFLYPENWLEPEWRDDRTPFFKELESELLQNDIKE